VSFLVSEVCFVYIHGRRRVSGKSDWDFIFIESRAGPGRVFNYCAILIHMRMHSYINCYSDALIDVCSNSLLNTVNIYHTAVFLLFV
jgi:hypothetical protein